MCDVLLTFIFRHNVLGITDAGDLAYDTGMLFLGAIHRAIVMSLGGIN